MDLKNRKYRFMITGYDNGKSIKPFVIIATISELESYLFTQGDSIRYYQEL